jgi:hypothetical protein
VSLLVLREYVTLDIEHKCVSLTQACSDSRYDRRQHGRPLWEAE